MLNSIIHRHSMINPLSDTEIQIIKSATRLFLTQGFSKTTHRQIAAESGIGLGTITYHYKVKEDMLINFAMSKALEAVKPATDDEIKAFYEENKDRFVAGESVSASHILVDSEEKEKELLEKINAGEISFEDAARQESSCPSSENGGSLGEFTKGQMVPEFDEAVFKMTVGEVTGPVKTQFGYHLIKLNAKNEAKTYALDEIKAQLGDMVMKEKQQKAYQSKLNQLKILFPVDKM